MKGRSAISFLSFLMALYAACSFTGSSMYIAHFQNYGGKVPASLYFSQKPNSEKKPWFVVSRMITQRSSETISYQQGTPKTCNANALHVKCSCSSTCTQCAVREKPTIPSALIYMGLCFVLIAGEHFCAARSCSQGTKHSVRSGSGCAQI